MADMLRYPAAPPAPTCQLLIDLTAKLGFSTASTSGSHLQGSWGSGNRKGGLTIVHCLGKGFGEPRLPVGPLHRAALQT